MKRELSSSQAAALTHGRHMKLARRVALTLVVLYMVATALLIFMTATAKGSIPIRVSVACDSALWERSLLRAYREVGTREATGRNDGVRVGQYLRSVGLGEGFPYCLAGHYYSFLETVSGLALTSRDIPILRTASTQACFDRALRTGTQEPLGSPRRGDIIIWKLGEQYLGHAERIWDAQDRNYGWIQTVAFNVSVDRQGSQRDGGGVALKLRNWRHPLVRMFFRGVISRSMGIT
ncbi:MAG: hypothetical protein HYX66_08915 [Ignavibacteria bacterium]|nr:hypothetical protein [Ignavibacteria bacterium]